MLEWKDDGSGNWHRAVFQNLDCYGPFTRAKFTFRDSNFVYLQNGTRHRRDDAGCGKPLNDDITREKLADVKAVTLTKLATVQRLLSLYFDIRDNNAFQSMPPTVRLAYAEGLLREALSITSEVAPE